MTPERLKEIVDSNKDENGKSVNEIVEICADMFISQTSRLNEAKKIQLETENKTKKIIENQESIIQLLNKIVRLEPPMIYKIYDESDEPIEDN